MNKKEETVRLKMTTCSHGRFYPAFCNSFLTYLFFYLILYACLKCSFKWIWLPQENLLMIWANVWSAAEDLDTISPFWSVLQISAKNSIKDSWHCPWLTQNKSYCTSQPPILFPSFLIGNCYLQVRMWMLL